MAAIGSPLLDLLTSLGASDYWPMQGDGRNLLAPSRTLSTAGTVAPTYGAGQFIDGSPATYFPGGNTRSRLEAASNAAWNMSTTARTFGVWFKTESFDTTAGTLMARRGDAATNFSLILRSLTSGRTLNGQTSDGSANDVGDASGGTCIAGQWQLAAFSGDDTTASKSLVVYLDGRSVATDTSYAGAQGNGTAALSFGSWNNGDTGQEFIGLMAHGFVVPAILTAADIWRIWTVGSATAPESQRRRLRR